MYAFQLGREYKLSLAEIFSRFPTLTIIYADKNVCIIETEKEKELLEKIQHMGGVIKLMKLVKNYRGKPVDNITETAEKAEGKFRFGLSQLGGSEANLKGFLMETKKSFKLAGISGRFVNKNFTNLSSAQIIGEDLHKRASDFTVIYAGGIEYFGVTVWVQDIEAYSKRDYGKTRDMDVGMLPPKLAQMMINIGGGTKIYDPFCGLGTLLIESILMQNTQVYGSDISPENIEKSKKNINYARKEFPNMLKTSMFEVLDAKGISSSPFLKKSDSIITEGYLGQVFQKYSISEKKIEEEKKSLLDMYTKFFQGLSRAHYVGTIVICFPFWEVRGKYHYFSEVYDLIKQYGKTLPLLPKHEEIKHTKSGSLLYKRPDQTVGREIFKLKIKK